MTAFVLEPQPFRRGPSPAEAAIVGVASAVALLAFFAAGVTFLALALGGRLTDVRVVYAILSIAAFGASAMVAAKAAGFLAPRD